MPQWAVEVMHSVTFCRTASRVAAVFAGLIAVSTVALIVLYVIPDETIETEAFTSIDSARLRYIPAVGAAIAGAFDGGVLLAVSALLRLQASRLESEVFGDEFDDR